MNKQDKQAIVARLIETRGKLQRVQLALALDSEDTTAVADKLSELDRAIDAIRRELHADWQGRASDVKADLARMNGRVQRRVHDIERKIRRADRIISLLGDVDEIIGRVRAFLP